MVLRVKLHGSGQDGDPWRVALPTYHLIDANRTQGWALVEAPDETLGLEPDDLQGETVEDTLHGPHLPNPSRGLLAKLHPKIDARYAEHAGEFRIEPA